MAAEERRALAHPDESLAVVAGVRRRRAAAVVGDLKFELGCAVADDDASARRAGVLERVGERLLDDPVGGQVDARSQRDGLALEPQLDRQPGAGHLLGENVEVAQARQRRHRDLVVGAAQHPEQAPHLG
ncbi:MAG: hypothetical protein M3N56_14705 [Actinomycetota bacterium]|nr:hypothetical protein [Actinomycetota bacterium]